MEYDLLYVIFNMYMIHKILYSSTVYIYIYMSCVSKLRGTPMLYVMYIVHKYTYVYMVSDIYLPISTR